MEYADVVWDNKTLFLINKLENVQIEVARIVTGGTRLVSINSLYKETGWETLQARRENHQKKYFYKMVNKGNNKITELRTILQRESQNS